MSYAPVVDRPLRESEAEISPEKQQIIDFRARLIGTVTKWDEYKKPLTKWGNIRDFDRLREDVGGGNWRITELTSPKEGYDKLTHTNAQRTVDILLQPGGQYPYDETVAKFEETILRDGEKEYRCYKNSLKALEEIGKFLDETLGPKSPPEPVNPQTTETSLPSNVEPSTSITNPAENIAKAVLEPVPVAGSAPIPVVEPQPILSVNPVSPNPAAETQPAPPSPLDPNPTT